VVSNPPLLSDYLLGLRRLLHDATGNYWSDSELIDYINTGRSRVVADTGCNRVLQTISTATGQETYPYINLPQGVNTFDVLNVTLIWGSTRVPLTYMSFTEFNLKMRAWQSFQSRPAAFTIYGQNTIYLGPIPDQIYVCEIDSVVSPIPLTSTAQQDIIQFPYSDPVIYYAASLAKFKEQSDSEAERFANMYTAKVGAAIRSSFTRRITNPYGR